MWFITHEFNQVYRKLRSLSFIAVFRGVSISMANWAVFAGYPLALWFCPVFGLPLRTNNHFFSIAGCVWGVSYVMSTTAGCGRG